MSTRRSLRLELDHYLGLRRALGFKLHNVGRLLGQFVDYLDEHGVHTPTTESALAWATLPAGASNSWRAIRLSAVRGFAAYLHSIDPSVEVPPAGLIRHGPDRATPYLYSEPEILALMREAAGLRPQLRAATYQTLIGLLAVSGLRVGEAIALDSADLDIDSELLVVRHTKFDSPVWCRCIRARSRPCDATCTFVTGRVRVRHARPCWCPPPGPGCCTPTSDSPSPDWPARPGSPVAQRPADRESTTFGTVSRCPPCWTGTARTRTWQP
jgi:hypothetical protein